MGMVNENVACQEKLIAQAPEQTLAPKSQGFVQTHFQSVNLLVMSLSLSSGNDKKKEKDQHLDVVARSGSDGLFIFQGVVITCNHYGSIMGVK